VFDFGRILRVLTEVCVQTDTKVAVKFKTNSILLYERTVLLKLVTTMVATGFIFLRTLVKVTTKTLRKPLAMATKNLTEGCSAALRHSAFCYVHS
jgi:dihydroorotase-like cyclic amidohydrolase